MNFDTKTITIAILWLLIAYNLWSAYINHRAMKAYREANELHMAELEKLRQIYIRRVTGRDSEVR